MELDRFVDEIEQVREALDLEDFYLFGHSCGGLFAIEYALNYQSHLKGLILGSVTGSMQSYMTHINHVREQLPASIIERLKGFEDNNDLETMSTRRYWKNTFTGNISVACPNGLTL